LRAEVEKSSIFLNKKISSKRLLEKEKVLDLKMNLKAMSQLTEITEILIEENFKRKRVVKSVSMGRNQKK